MTHYDLIVIGGGVSGLTFARRGAAQGWHTLLLEADGRFGGCLASHRYGGAAEGFWTELAAHTAYNSYGALLELLDETGLGRLQTRRKAPWRVWDGKCLQSVFARMHWPSLLPSLPKLLFTPKLGLSLRDYYGRVMGRRTYDGLLRHAFSAVLAQPADDFPADLLFRKKPRRKDLPRSYTLKGGLSGLAEMLAAMPGHEAKTGIAVERIERVAEGFRVHAGQDQWTCRRLALAVPAWEAARLLDGEFPDLSHHLKQIAAAEVESLAVVVPKEGLALPELAGVIGIDQDFYSVVSRDVVPDARFRGFTFHFQPGRFSREEKLARIASLLEVPIDRFVQTAERTSRLPSLKAGHLAWVSEVDLLLSGEQLALVGNYFYGVSLGDCAERSKAEFDRLCRSAS
ncbi:MAG: FAD-dependent oxidoreductase [Hydrogenophilaceae bacterium]|nr:FAD-dependent oxidoreductase [Hydrogenophilaceae bacterium]